MAVTNLAQYPAPPGNRNQVVATFTGPASYAQVVTGNPPTGGFVITAAQLGLTAIEWAEVSLSDDGQYGGEVIFDNNPTKETPQIRVEFFVANTGAQVAATTNLSARSFRILAFGL